MPLTDVKVRNADPQQRAYRIPDAKGLHLFVTPSGGKLWRWKYRFGGAQKLMALGKYPEVSLAAARERHAAARRQLAAGSDPMAVRKAEKVGTRASAESSFQAVAAEWMKHWRVDKSAQHIDATWRRIEANVLPHIGSRPIGEIEPPELVAMVKVIEARGVADLAKRALQTTGQIFRYAIAHGLAKRNPVAESKPSDVLKPTKKVNLARVDTAELPALLRAIEVYRGTQVTRLAMKLMALTFVRTSELIEARWSEFDLENARWNIPAERMKKDTPHIVPLSCQAIEVLELLKTLTGSGDLLFPGERNSKKPMSNNTILFALDRIRDITARKKAEPFLTEMEAKYRGLLEAAPDAMVVVNQGGEIVLLNVQAEKQFGYRRDELIGQMVKNIIPEGFAERLIADAHRSAEDALAQQIGSGIELNGRRKDGSEFPIEIMLSPLESAEGMLVTAAIRDITTRKNAEANLFQKIEALNRSNEELVRLAHAAWTMTQQMTHAAEHDALTGLPNRLLLNDRIGQAIAFAQRHENQAAVLFLDLDGFKHINDSLGHPIGDKLLQLLAKRLVNCVRTTDTVSRQGGDEFVVLISEGHQPEYAAAVSRRLLHVVAEASSIEKHDLHITASIGISIYPDDGRDAETLIKNADTAMYHAKEDGHQSFQFFTPAMNTQAVERQSIEEYLRRALERQEFTLHYQPKINIRTGAITGVEALIRWTHPTLGSVPPLQFIPVAEDCGLIQPIGAWVLREACAQAKAWANAGLPMMTMAVNVSASQFRNEGFLDDLFTILSETGLDPSYLELELTESALMKRVEITASILSTLRGKGVRVAIDDFGTGYSSLSYLRKFPLDALKIDQSFVQQITTIPDETTIVRAIISMGRSLNLRVIAEGVETPDQLDFLKAHECEEAQGYYFSRPVPPEKLVKLLETR
jgi:diguanylate cyclase (GGDEF)-like protein/PAS domain S-box-containing protein